MAGNFALEWHVADDVEHQRASISSVDELRSQLTLLEGQALTDFPFMVDLIAGDGRTLGIGLGRSVSVAHWISEGGDPPYYVSRGNLADMPEVIVFFAHSQWTEFAGHSAISPDAAHSALEAFFLAGQRSEDILWEEV